MNLQEAIEVLKDLKNWYNLPSHDSIAFDGKSAIEAIDTVLQEFEKECDHPYAFVHGGCGKAERCLKCGKIISD